MSGGYRPGAGRPVIDYEAEVAALDALSRTRALTLAESLRLEACVRELEGRRRRWPSRSYLIGKAR